MPVRLVALIMLALSAAGGTALMVRDWVSAQRAVAVAAAPVRAVKEPTDEVLVARRSLPAGTLLKPDHVTWQAWPKEGVNEIYIVKGKAKQDEMLGAVVRAGVTKGEPITTARIVKPGDRGFLAAVLKPGMRAVSVQVNATTGISGFVFPGDRIDLILSHGIQVDVTEGTRQRRASETVLSDVRVLAVDQKTDDQDGTPSVAKTATLEVTPKQAELVAVAVELGKLSLSLHALTPSDSEDDRLPAQVLAAAGAASQTQSFTWDSDISAILPRSDAPADEAHIIVMHGEKAEKVTVP